MIDKFRSYCEPFRETGVCIGNVDADSVINELRIEVEDDRYFCAIYRSDMMENPIRFEISEDTLALFTDQLNKMEIW